MTIFHKIFASAVLAGLLTATAPLKAGLVEVNFFKNIVYTQTTGAAPSTPSTFFASFGASHTSGDGLTSAQVTYPGPSSPQALSVQNASTFGFQTGGFASQALMDAAYPFGAYQFSATPGVNTATIQYNSDSYTSTIPALTAATFSALQGMHPDQSFTANFNAFTPGAGSNGSFTFFDIAGFFDGFLPNTTTSVVIPANTLLPNTTYTFDLDFSSRVNGTSGSVSTLGGFEVRTDGTFKTGALSTPEPSTVIPLGLAALAGFAVRRRQR